MGSHNHPTWEFLYQKMYWGGSGLSLTTQVRLRLLPSSRKMFGPPRISVIGSWMGIVILDTKSPVYNDYYRRHWGTRGDSWLGWCSPDTRTARHPRSENRLDEKNIISLKYRINWIKEILLFRKYFFWCADCYCLFKRKCEGVNFLMDLKIELKIFPDRLSKILKKYKYRTNWTKKGFFSFQGLDCY